MGNGEVPADSMLPVNHGSRLSNTYISRPLVRKMNPYSFRKPVLKPAEVSNSY